MIKVIKNMTLEKPKKMYFKIACTNCESEFIFDSDDSHECIRKLYDKGWKIHDNRAIICPVCSTINSYYLYNNTKFMSDNKSLETITRTEYERLLGENND